MLRIVLAALAALMIAAAGPPAFAEPDEERSALRMTPAEAEDLAILETAMKALQQQGYAGLSPSLPALRAALDRAPDLYPMFEIGQDTMIVRSPEIADMVIGNTMLSALHERGETAPTSVVQQPNVYPEIALTLGSEAIERGRYSEGIDYLDRGLRLQPNHWMLLGEKAAAMQGQKRWAEALAFADEALARNDAWLQFHAAPLHRRRGFSLIELGRLAEAKAAYEKSLELEPDNETAKHELAYIERLEHGGDPWGTTLVAPASKNPAD